MTNNYNSPAKDFVDIAIEIDTGPEVIAGSTRLKAGTFMAEILEYYFSPLYRPDNFIEIQKKIIKRKIKHKLKQRKKLIRADKK